jgi:DNA polymerase V
MKIAAGPPSPNEDSIEDRIDLTEYLIPRPEKSFLIRVEGESMIDAGVFPDDLLVVERADEAQNGDVVVALIGGRFTVKRFQRHGDRLRLVSANKERPESRHEDFSVWGIVRYCIHKF